MFADGCSTGLAAWLLGDSGRADFMLLVIDVLVFSMKKLLLPLLLVVPLLASCDDSNPLTSGKRCDDFDSQEDAQRAFENGKTGLDGDNDGIACEHL